MFHQLIAMSKLVLGLILLRASPQSSPSLLQNRAQSRIRRCLNNCSWQLASPVWSCLKEHCIRAADHFLKQGTNRMPAKDAKLSELFLLPTSPIPTVRPFSGLGQSELIKYPNIGKGSALCFWLLGKKKRAKGIWFYSIRSPGSRLVVHLQDAGQASASCAGGLVKTQPQAQLRGPSTKEGSDGLRVRHAIL